MPPKFYVNNLDGRFAAIQDDLNRRYHSPGLACDPGGKTKISDAELTEQATLSSYAAHASDGLNYKEGDQYVGGVHIERLIK